MNQNQIIATLSQINNKGLEATFSLSESALENAQKLARLSYAASKDVLVNTQDGIQQALTAKDPKQFTELLSPEALQAASTQAVAYQKKVSKVLRDNNKEFTNVVDVSIDQLQDDLQDWINTVAANAPAGSAPFLSSFKTVYASVLQGLEQFRAASKEAFITAEKTAEQAIEALQGQIAQAKKSTTPASRARKVV